MADKTGERIYTIPLRKGWLKTPRGKRTNRTIRDIKAFLERHMKATDVKISQRVNEKLWERGIKKPPGKIKVKVKADENGVVTARLPEEMELVKKEKKKGMLDALKGRAGVKEDTAPAKPAEAPKEEAKPEEKKEEAPKEEPKKAEPAETEKKEEKK